MAPKKHHEEMKKEMHKKMPMKKMPEKAKTAHMMDKKAKHKAK